MIRRWSHWLVLLTLLGTTLAADETCRDATPARLADRRFTLHDDGTVSDASTGLMWKQCAEGLSGVGCTVGEPLTFRWKWAQRQGRATPFAGHVDWRLPNQQELQSLLEPRCLGLTIDVVTFPNTPPGRFWSSTPSNYYGGSAWTVHFGDGSVGYGTQSDSAYVRLVRDRY